MFYCCGGKSSHKDWKIAEKDLSCFCGQLKMHGFKRMLIFPSFLCVIGFILCPPLQVWFMPQSCCLFRIWRGYVLQISSQALCVWWNLLRYIYFLKTLKQTVNQGLDLIWKLLEIMLLKLFDDKNYTKCGFAWTSSPSPLFFGKCLPGAAEKNAKAAGGYLTSNKSCLMTPAFQDPTKHHLRSIPKMFLRCDELEV